MKVTELNSLEISYKREFANWMKEENKKVYDKLSDATKDAGKDLFKGQKVNVINGGGIEIGPYEIVGFCKPDKYGNCVYLDWDCYWFTKNIEDIIID